MSSSGSWTNRTRVLAQARPLKVQISSRVAGYNPLISVANCNRDFTPINYVSNQCCNLKPGNLKLT